MHFFFMKINPPVLLYMFDLWTLVNNMPHLMDILQQVFLWKYNKPKYSHVPFLILIWFILVRGTSINSVNILIFAISVFEEKTTKNSTRQIDYEHLVTHISVKPGKLINASMFSWHNSQKLATAKINTFTVNPNILMMDLAFSA